MKTDPLISCNHVLCCDFFIKYFGPEGDEIGKQSCMSITARPADQSIHATSYLFYEIKMIRG